MGARGAIGTPGRHRATRLFLALAGFFVTDALLAEFVGVKIFSLERTLGIADVHWSLLGVSGTLNFTAGVIYWPLVFVLTDIINEYFGLRGVRLVSWLAVAFISWAFRAAYVAIPLAPAPFWVECERGAGRARYPAAYALIFGQGMWTIAVRSSRSSSASWSTSPSSIASAPPRASAGCGCGPPAPPPCRSCSTASSCCTSPSCSARSTGRCRSSWQWARSTTCYKMLAAVAMIPLLYLVHAGVRRFLGRERTEQLRNEAAR